MAKSTNYGGRNELQCENCDDYMYLNIKNVRFENNTNTKAIGLKLPVYECKNCGFTYQLKSKEKTLELASKLLEELREGEFVPLKNKQVDKTLENYD